MSRSSGLALMAAGGILGIPVLFWIGLIEFSVSTATATATVATSATVATAAATTSGLVTTASAATAATLFSLSTLGIGALVIYASIGVAYLYSGARECYKTDRNVLQMLQSNISLRNGVSFKGVLNTIGAVLWSPFLAVGGLLGMAVKAGVNTYNRRNSATDLEMDDVTTVEYDDMDELDQVLPPYQPARGTMFKKTPQHQAVLSSAPVPGNN